MFLLKLIIFFLIVILCIYFPGRLILGKKKEIDKQESFFLSLVIGIAIIIFQTVIFGLFKIRFLSLFIILILSILGIRKYFKSFTEEIKIIFKNKLLILIIILGILIQGFINFPSGWQYKDGINFWSSQGHDGLWHVSLMEEIKTTFPPTNPLYAGHPLQNYHYTSDIFMGEFYRLFPFFSSLDLYFRFYPILFSFLISFGVYCFVKRKWDQNAAYWSMFFTLFCGSFGYIIYLINSHLSTSVETVFWGSQGNTILGNPPHTLGIIFLTALLLLISIWLKNRNNFWLIIIICLGFGLSTIKVSSGIIFVGSFLVMGLYLFAFKKDYIPLLVGVGLSISNFLMLKIISPSAQSFLVFEPLWFPRTMMVVKLKLSDWELRRQNYIFENTFKSLIHRIILEIQAISIFIIGNTGLRVVGLVEIFKKLKKKIDPVDIFMISGSLFTLIIVLLFVQKGSAFNLIQFIQIYFHLIGIYAGVTVSNLINKTKSKIFKIIIIFTTILLAVPTVIGNLVEFYGPSHYPVAVVSNSELSALNWIKENTPKDSIIFTKPFNEYTKDSYKVKTLPISIWSSTMYVHSFTSRHTFLSGEGQLEILNYNTNQDIKDMKKFIDQSDISFNNLFLTNNKISYLYFRLDEIEKQIDLKKNNLTEVFKNNEIIIYKYK